MINVPPVVVKVVSVTSSGAIYGRSQSQLYRPALVGGTKVIRELPICVNTKMPYLFKVEIPEDASVFRTTVMDPFGTEILEWWFETWEEVEP